MRTYLCIVTILKSYWDLDIQIETPALHLTIDRTEGYVPIEAIHILYRWMARGMPSARNLYQYTVRSPSSGYLYLKKRALSHPEALVFGGVFCQHLLFFSRLIPCLSG